MASVHSMDCECERCVKFRARQAPVLTKQNLNWMRLDRATSVMDDSDLYRLLINFSTEGFALDLKVSTPAADVIGALRDLAARMEHQLGLNQRAADEPPSKSDAEFLSLVGHCSNCSCQDCREFFKADAQARAEPPADRKSALDEIVRISEEAGLYGGRPANRFCSCYGAEISSMNCMASSLRPGVICQRAPNRTRD